MNNTENLLQQLLMIGIGTTSLVTEKIQEVTNRWVKDGTINPDQAKIFVVDKSITYLPAKNNSPPRG